MRILEDRIHLKDVGSDLDLTCVISTEVDPDIVSWNVDGKKMDKRAVVQTSIVNGTSVSSLKYQNLTLKDGGNITCQIQHRNKTIVSNKVPFMVLNFKIKEIKLSVTKGVYFPFTCYSYRDDLTITLNGRRYTFKITGQHDEGDGWKRIEMTAYVKTDSTINCLSEYLDTTSGNYTYQLSAQNLGQGVITPAEGYPMIPKGSSFNLTCSIKTTHQIEIDWTISRGRTPANWKTSTFSNGTQTSVLKITNVQRTGSYECYARINRYATTRYVTVGVFDRKYFTVNTVSHVQAGTNVTVICYAPLKSKEIFFTKDNKTIELQYTKKNDRVFYGFTMNSYEVLISITSLKDAGSYSCFSKLGEYEIYRMNGKLDVYETPEIVVDGAENGQLVVGSGSDIRIRCRMRSTKDIYSRTRFGLIKNNRYIKYVYAHKYSTENSTISAVFDLRRANYWYTGRYEIGLYIDRKTIKSNYATINIITNRKTQTTKSVAIGGSTSITCYTLNMTNTYFKYYYNDTQREVDNSTLKANGTELRSGIVWRRLLWTISDIQQKDTGIWECKGFYKTKDYSSSKLDLRVLAYSASVTKLVKEIGDDVSISCLWMNKGGLRSKYYINDTLFTGARRLSLGAKFSVSGISYRWVYWRLGKMTFDMMGKYQCQSWYSGEMATNMTTFLSGFELKSPKGILSSTESVNVSCTYDGPKVEAMVWARDGNEISGLKNYTIEKRTIRTDILTITGLNQDTTRFTVSCQYLNKVYSLDVEKKFMVTYAVSEQFPETTMYTGNSVNLTCGYQGRDTAEINWYYERYAGSYSLIRSKYNNRYQQITSFNNATYHAKYLWKTNMNFIAMRLKCVIDFGGYELDKITRIARKEFSTKMQDNTVVSPSDIKLTCTWGSSDRPANVTWLIDGEEGVFPVHKTKSRGYLMTSIYPVSVDGTSYNTSYECVFMDKAGTKASSFTRVYGATVEIPQGKSFAPSARNNKVECNYQSVLTADSLDWVYENKIVNDSEAQHIFKKDTSHISLTTVEIDPQLDGAYSCVATVLGNQITNKITITHSEVIISGQQVRYAIGTQVETLECNAASRGYVYYILWLVNGDRSSSYNKVQTTSYINYERNSTLIAKPYLDAKYKANGVLEYTCFARTRYGSFEDRVEIHVRAASIKPSPYIALSSTWEITCSIITDVKPSVLYWIKDGVVLHKNDAFSLEGSLNDTVKYVFKQDKNDFILNTTDSSYDDSGSYTCKFEYDDGPSTSSLSNITVRTISSSVERLHFAKEGKTSLDCSLESKLKPKSVQWTRFRSAVRGSTAKSTVTRTGNTSKSILTFPKAIVANWGFYTCRFIFADGKNPELSTNLQFADLTMKSSPSLNLQAGSSLTITATYYSSNFYNKKLTWYKDGKVVLPSQGFSLWSRYVSYGKYNIYLRKRDMESSYAGNYSVQLTTGRYPVSLKSTVVTVGVIGSSGGTQTIYNTGGSQTISCMYTGSMKPTKVEWFYNNAPLNKTRWTVKSSNYEHSSLNTSITADNLKYTESGDYTCAFQSGDNSVSSDTQLNVRTIETSVSGQMYVTDSEMKLNVTVRSAVAPYMMLAYVGKSRIYMTIKTVKVSKTEIRYEASYSYKYRRAGSYDGDYEFQVRYSKGPILLSKPLAVTVRKAYTVDKKVITKLTTSSTTVTFIRTCIYNGREIPVEVQWYLSSKLVNEDQKHEVSNNALANLKVSSKMSPYKQVTSVLKVTNATWQDSGVYSCKFTFKDGHDPTATVPQTTIVENSGVDRCFTSLDGAYTSTCIYKSMDTLKSVKWYRSRQLIKGAASTSYVNNTMSAVLNITGANSKSDGIYYCMVETSKGVKLISSTKVLFPKVTLTVYGGKSGTYYSGTRVVFRCSATYTVSGLRIYRNGEDTRRSSYLSIYVSAKVAGNYTCKGSVQNTCSKTEIIGKTATGLSVINIDPATPSIISDPSDITTEEGGTVTFTCVTQYISGVNTKIVWNRENPYKYKYRKKTTTSTSKGTITSLFILSRITMAYAGDYYCKAYYGGVAVTSKSGQLSIVAFKTHPTDVTAIIGSDNQLSCVFSGLSKVTLELLKENRLSNKVAEMSYNSDTGPTYSSGVFKFTNITSNDVAEYKCRVQKTKIVSGSAKLITLEIAKQPINTYQVIGNNAQFYVLVTYNRWPNMSVIWQKEVAGSWVNATASKYVMRRPSYYRSAGKIYYKLQLDIRKLDASDVSKWRVRVIFPSTEKLRGGELVSDSAAVTVAGINSVTVTSADKFQGTTVTVKCEVSSDKKPRTFYFYIGKYKQRWRYKVEAGNGIYTAVVSFRMSSYYSGKEITCKSNIKYKWVAKKTTLYNQYANCPTLRTREYGKIAYVQLNETRRQANLTCTGTNIYVMDRTKTLAICDYVTGKWNQTMTVCVKRTPIDPKLLRLWRINVYYRTADYCKTAAQKKIVYKNFGMKKIKDPQCGFTSVDLNVKCYWAGTCDFLSDKSVCLNNGKGGMNLYGYFNYTGALNFKKGSDYMMYRADIKSKRVTTKFFRCKSAWSPSYEAMYESRKKKRSIEDDFINRDMDMENQIDNNIIKQLPSADPDKRNSMPNLVFENNDSPKEDIPPETPQSEKKQIDKEPVVDKDKEKPSTSTEPTTSPTEKTNTATESQPTSEPSKEPEPVKVPESDQGAQPPNGSEAERKHDDLRTTEPTSSPTSPENEYEGYKIEKGGINLNLTDYDENALIHKMVITGAILVIFISTIIILKLTACRLCRNNDRRGDYVRVATDKITD